MGAVKIAVLLSRREHVRVSHMTVHRLLRRLHLVRPQRQRKRHYRPWSRQRPNELWQLDFKGPYDRDGRSIHRLDIIDDASRFLLSSVECESPSSSVVLEAVQATARRFGRPVQVLTDNGSVFVPVRGRGLSAFQRWCIRSSVQHIRARRNHPQTIGKVERLHRTIDEETGRMGMGLDEYIVFYNHDRPHASIGHRTPAELYLTPRRRSVP
jgi:transposase InsO family protein